MLNNISYIKKNILKRNCVGCSLTGGYSQTISRLVNEAHTVALLLRAVEGQEVVSGTHVSVCSRPGSTLGSGAGN